MKKAATTGIIMILTYVLPLLERPKLIINCKIIFLALFFITLFMTQPKFDIREVEEKKNTDKSTILIILVMGIMTQIITIIEWAYFPISISPNMSHYLTIVGVLFMIIGLGFRVWAIRTLGQFFTATVQVNTKQQIITTGPYAIVRHPSYLGAYVAIIGSTIFISAIGGVMLSTIGMFIAYKLRIHVEEILLLKEFGKEYLDYQLKTSRMIPLIW